MAYDVEAWSDLFVACAGAAAALTGLVFVAVSINIERILALPGVPERALQTLLVLLSVVIVSVFGLAPGQSDTAFGVELIVVGLAFTVAVAVLGTEQGLRRRPHRRRAGGPAGRPGRRHHAGRDRRHQPGWPAAAAGSTGSWAGSWPRSWRGVINAWVVLVEILR